YPAGLLLVQPSQNLAEGALPAPDGAADAQNHMAWNLAADLGNPLAGRVQKGKLLRLQALAERVGPALSLLLPGRLKCQAEPVYSHRGLLEIDKGIAEGGHGPVNIACDIQ